MSDRRLPEGYKHYIATLIGPTNLLGPFFLITNNTVAATLQIRKHANKFAVEKGSLPDFDAAQVMFVEASDPPTDSLLRDFFRDYDISKAKWDAENAA